MILCLDDENRIGYNYFEELRLSGHEISFHMDVDSAFNFFNKNYSKIELIILDIMMPSGHIFRNEETEFGLRTGILFYEKVRQKTEDLPVIFLTNVKDEQIVESFINQQNCFYFIKENYLPSELVDEVNIILKKQYNN